MVKLESLGLDKGGKPRPLQQAELSLAFGKAVQDQDPELAKQMLSEAQIRLLAGSGSGGGGAGVNQQLYAQFKHFIELCGELDLLRKVCSANFDSLLVR
jgi:hypothetical protein